MLLPFHTTPGGQFADTPQLTSPGQSGAVLLPEEKPWQVFLGPKNSHEDCIHTPGGLIHQLSKTYFPRGHPLCRGQLQGRGSRAFQTCVSHWAGSPAPPASSVCPTQPHTRLGTRAPHKVLAGDRPVPLGAGCEVDQASRKVGPDCKGGGQDLFTSIPPPLQPPPRSVQ